MSPEVLDATRVTPHPETTNSPPAAESLADNPLGLPVTDLAGFTQGYLEQKTVTDSLQSAATAPGRRYNGPLGSDLYAVLRLEMSREEFLANIEEEEEERQEDEESPRATPAAGSTEVEEQGRLSRPEATAPAVAIKSRSTNARTRPESGRSDIPAPPQESEDGQAPPTAARRQVADRLIHLRATRAHPGQRVVGVAALENGSPQALERAAASLEATATPVAGEESAANQAHWELSQALDREFVQKTALVREQIVEPPAAERPEVAPGPVRESLDEELPPAVEPKQTSQAAKMERWREPAEQALALLPEDQDIRFFDHPEPGSALALYQEAEDGLRLAALRAPDSRALTLYQEEPVFERLVGRAGPYLIGQTERHELVVVVEPESFGRLENVVPQNAESPNDTETDHGHRFITELPGPDRLRAAVPDPGEGNPELGEPARPVRLAAEARGSDRPGTGTLPETDPARGRPRLVADRGPDYVASNPAVDSQPGRLMDGGFTFTPDLPDVPREDPEEEVVDTAPTDWRLTKNQGIIEQDDDIRPTGRILERGAGKAA